MTKKGKRGVEIPLSQRVSRVPMFSSNIQAPHLYEKGSCGKSRSNRENGNWGIKFLLVMGGGVVNGGRSIEKSRGIEYCHYCHYYYTVTLSSIVYTYLYCASYLCYLVYSLSHTHIHGGLT